MTSTIRSTLENKEFLEIETPVLQGIAGKWSIDV